MNRKGQLGVLWAIVNLIIFVILWALFLGSWVNTWSNNMIVNNGLVGVEAFLIAYLNLWIWCGVMIGMLIIGYFGSGT